MMGDASTHPLFDTPLPMGWKLLLTDDVKSPEKSSCVAGPFGSNISSKFFVESGVPIIRGGNLRSDLTRFVPSGFAFVSEEQAMKYKAQHVRAGDLVFTCWGTLGQVGLIPKTGPFPEYIISNKQLKLRPNLDIADPEYLFYYFAGPKMVQHVLGKAIGAAVPGINLGILKEIPLVLPPLVTQQRIAGILSAYDELIKNNQQRIKILESMARALYREWFVYFRFPGYESKPHDPSILINIPYSFEVMKLGDLCELRKDHYRDQEHSELPLVDMARIPSHSLAPSDLGTPDELATSRILFKEGDTLFGAIRCYLHKVITMHFPGVTNTSVLVLRPKKDCFRALLAIVASDIDTIRWAEKQSTGTKMPVINWGVFQGMPTPIPSEALAQSFEEIAGPMMEEIGVLATKIQNLRRTRDLLLPRLLSGQIDVFRQDEEGAA